MLRTRIRVALVVALFTLIVAPVAALALTAAETTDYADDILGGSASPMPGSPFTGDLNEVTDPDDVFQLDLTAGQNFFVKMAGAAGSDFDLYLFPPGTASVAGTTPASMYSETSGASSERILYQNVPVSGRYFLDAWAFAGSGTYTITYGFPSVTPSLLATAPTTVAWAGGAVVRGTMQTPSQSPVAGETVYVYAKGYRDSTFKKVAQDVTDATGAYAVTVKPSSVTRYRVRFLGSPAYLPVTAPDLTVSPYAYLTSPTAPSTVKASASFTSVGYLKPRHTAGTKPVKLSCYRLENNVWRVRKTVYATCSNYGTYSKYVARYSLPYKGRWKVTASVPADALHLTTATRPRYLTVVQ